MTKQKTKVTMETIQELCEQNNWTCMENKYINANTSMEWQCNVCAFEWKSNYNNTRKRKGCSRCINGKSQYTHNEVVIEAKKKGCKPTEEYKRSNISIGWECLSCEYNWKTSFSNIKRTKGIRCPKCNGNRSQYTLEEVHEIAAEKNLICLSETYTDCSSKMNWKCKKCDREWETSFRSIVQNIGCLKCTFKEK